MLDQHPISAFDIYLNASGTSRDRTLNNWWRIARRRIRRRLLNRTQRLRPRFFCQNSGGCGSTYIVRLLAENGIENCFHELPPDLNSIGIQHYDSPINDRRLVGILRYTRWDVFFEANNRLFSLSPQLACAFPSARFIHLHRDGRQAVASAMSKPDIEAYLASNIRFQGSLAGPHQAEPFERFCHYWNNMNRRILNDLQAMIPVTGPHLSLKFCDLISGQIDGLSRFLGRELRVLTCAVTNRGRVGQGGRFPAYRDWPLRLRKTFECICGETMQRLGY